jgi:hypothetical protein
MMIGGRMKRPKNYGQVDIMPAAPRLNILPNPLKTDGSSMCIFRMMIASSVVAALAACNIARAEDSLKETGKDFNIGGYSSAAFQIEPGGHANAALDQLSLILSKDINERLKLFTEVELEYPLSWQSGSSELTDDSRVDLERLYADYSFSNLLNLRVGRFLSPIGIWNLIHAAPLVWTTVRPAATRKLFPQSNNGLMLHGVTPFWNGAVEYSAYIEVLKDQDHDPGEIPLKKTRGIRLAYDGAAELGLSLDEFEGDDHENSKYRMIGLDFLKEHNGWEISGEYYKRFQDGKGDDSSGGYLQVVAPLVNRWFAVGRLENLQLPEHGTTGRWLVGTAWRFKEGQVIKLEYDGGQKSQYDMPRGFIASYAILF